MRTVSLGEYRNLMHAFSSGRIGETDFEESYLRLSKEDGATRSEEISRILDAVSAGLHQPNLMGIVTAALRTLDAMRHGA